jgi:hypothetical protein
LRFLEHAAFGGDAPFAALQIAVPYGRCFAFHKNFLSMAGTWIRFGVEETNADSTQSQARCKGNFSKNQREERSTGETSRE